MWPGIPEEGGPPAAQGDPAQQREAAAQLPPHGRALPQLSASSPTPPPPPPSSHSSSNHVFFIEFNFTLLRDCKYMSILAMAPNGW